MLTNKMMTSSQGAKLAASEDEEEEEDVDKLINEELDDDGEV